MFIVYNYSFEVQHTWIFHFMIFLQFTMIFKTSLGVNLKILESSGGDIDYFIGLWVM
jgi:hypothetical protein